MSYASNYTPELFDAQEDDLRNDADYQRWCADLESQFAQHMDTLPADYIERRVEHANLMYAEVFGVGSKQN